jgi:hypothetical protein
MESLKRLKNNERTFEPTCYVLPHTPVPCRLRIRAIAAVATVGADELAVQAEHLHPAQFAFLVWGLQRLGGLRFFLVPDLIHKPRVYG